MKLKNGRPVKPRELQGKKLSELNAEYKKFAHHIDKRQVNLKTAGEGTGATVGGTFVPDAEQLAKINNFTRIEATADNVVAFRTMSCNDLLDRDDEAFTKGCIDAFAALQPPYSFTGKSFMSDHEYQMANVRGRIFDTDKATEGGVHFVTNSIYVPRTAQYADYIENLDFGLAWAVSVGVVIDKATCSICKAPCTTVFRWTWCKNGHDKGYFYVPGEEEDDGWGGYMPVDPSTKGAVKCTVDLDDPIDAYELSQVFLGAQYYAELAKKPGFSGAIKAAGAHGGVVGLSSAESDLLSLPKLPAPVREARAKFFIMPEKDGSYRWQDDKGLVWSFDPEEQTVGCLGKAETAPPEEEEVDEGTEDESEESGEDAEGGKSPVAIQSAISALRRRAEGLSRRASSFAAGDGGDSVDADEDDEDPKSLAETLDAQIDSAQSALDDGNAEQASDILDGAEDTADKLLDALGGTDADEEGESDEEGAEGRQKASGDSEDDSGAGHSHEHTHDGKQPHSHDHTHSSGNYDHGSKDPEVAHEHSHDASNEPDNDESGSGSDTDADGDSKVVSAMRLAGISESIVATVAKVPTGDQLVAFAIETGKALRKAERKAAELTDKAALGDQFLSEVQADAIHWFTMGRRDPKNPHKGVNVSLAQKLVEQCGGDITLIKALAEDWKKEAQRLFPPAVRRSTFPSDANTATPPPPPGFKTAVTDVDPDLADSVRRLHS